MKLPTLNLLKDIVFKGEDSLRLIRFFDLQSDFLAYAGLVLRGVDCA